MLEIHYREDGVVYSDFNLLSDAQRIINDYKNGKCSIRSVSTHSIIEALRVLISRGELPYNEVKIVFGEEIITLNKFVEYSHFPKGFFDWDKEFLKEIIGRRLGLMGFPKSKISE